MKAVVWQTVWQRFGNQMTCQTASRFGRLGGSVAAMYIAALPHRTGAGLPHYRPTIKLHE